MSLATLMRKPATLQHMGETAAGSRGQRSRTVLDQVDVVGGPLMPVTEVEALDAAETYAVTWQFPLPPGTVVSARDRLLIDGKPFEITKALPVTHPRTGRAHHVETFLEEITG